MDKETEMKKLEQGVNDCKLCSLYETRNNPVIGEGSLDVKILFIGEGPGYWEDMKGRPFVGRSGKVLDELLESIGLKREDVYIANIVKCRPPENRNPMTEEIKACTPFLDLQIEIIQPKIIATLGNFATSFIFEKFGLEKKSISTVHGKVFDMGSVKIIPLFHPAVAVYNSNRKGELMEDFKNLRSNE